MDRDIADVLIQMETSVSVKGTVSVEGEIKVELQSIRITLMPIEAMGPSCETDVHVDGDFVLEGCSPGRYTINMLAPAGTFLKAVRYGDTDITESPVVIGSSGPELKIVLERGGARLRGTIAAPEAEASVSACYLVARRTSQVDSSGMRLGHSDRGGAFFVKDLPPGRYRVFGFVTLDRGAVATSRTLRALESFGTEVDLKENEEAMVTTPLISADEAERIFRAGR